MIIINNDDDNDGGNAQNSVEYFRHKKRIFIFLLGLQLLCEAI